MNTRLLRAIGLGARLGFAVGLLLLGASFLVAVRCLPYHLSQPPPPWPWYCSAPNSSVISYLAFPVNLLTDDLASAIRLAPLSLLVYTLLGAGIGWFTGRAHLPA
jgi:hypothetical protein